MKRRGEKIAVLTAYDCPTAKAEVAAGVDLILVGDSVGTNILGYESERDVTVSDIAHHVAAVRRGAPATCIMADLPWGSYDIAEAAIANARHLVEAGADIVKFEGSDTQIAKALSESDICVCGHLGLEPQHHHDRKVRGKSSAEAIRLIAAATALEEAGISMLVLELIPEEVGESITSSIAIPTIGIGAGRYTDGQVLVICDVLGLSEFEFKHNKQYAALGTRMREATASFVNDVKRRSFPSEANVFHMPEDQLAAISSDTLAK